MWFSATIRNYGSEAWIDVVEVQLGITDPAPVRPLLSVRVPGCVRDAADASNLLVAASEQLFELAGAVGEGWTPGQLEFELDLERTELNPFDH